MLARSSKVFHHKPNDLLKSLFNGNNPWASI